MMKPVIVYQKPYTHRLQYQKYNDGEKAPNEQEYISQRSCFESEALAAGVIALQKDTYRSF
jgi:hypothetical protein